MTRIDLENLILLAGAHDANDDKVCLLEACALMAGEPKTDHPACVYSVFVAAGRVINDGPWADDAARTSYLREYVPRLVGTSRLAGDPARDARVARAAADCAATFAKEFDDTLTPGERIAKNAPVLMEALLRAAGAAE
jgi:hypothetical protein